MYIYIYTHTYTCRVSGRGSRAPDATAKRRADVTVRVHAAIAEAPRRGVVVACTGFTIISTTYISNTSNK